jgi:uncharacterized caspase-like protein
MKHSLSILGLLIWGAVVLLLQTDPAAAERRVALVLGNSAYQSASLNLVNPKNDAEDVAAALKGLGFEVVVETDVSLSDTNRALQKFARMAAEADTALFFYAGHALQYQGHNYLMPVDADVKDEISLPFETVAVENVRAALDRSNGIKIMILDACRNNPIAEKLAKLAGAATSSPMPANERSRGLERIDKTQGLIVAYATGADEVALDGQARNSPFTTAFLKRLNEPGLEIEMMFRRIANDVNVATDGRQRPETYVSLVSEYYLNQNDRVAWEQIKESNDPAAFRDFLAHYPSSYYSIEARYRLDALYRALEETKKRALQEAEDKRRETEKAEQEAALKLKAEKACQANRTALDAIGTRDQNGLKGFIDGNPCDEAKQAAQKRLIVLQETLAAEAETCRHDADALTALGPRDLAGIKALSQKTTCADVKTAAQGKIAAIEADIAAEQETCKREDNELKNLAKAGNRAEIDNLRQHGKCPATAAAADQAMRDVIAAAEAETCKHEDGELKSLTKSANRAEIENLRQRAKCPATAPAAEQAVRDIIAAADAACAKDNAALAAIGPRDADALRTMANKASCDVVKTAAQQRLAALDHDKEICKRDEDQWKGLTKSTNRGEVEALRQHVECPAVANAIDQKIAELKTACDRDSASLSSIGASDAGALRSFLSKATCDDAKTNAQTRLATLEADALTRANHEKDICRRDEDNWKQAGSFGKPADIEALRQRLECPAIVALADKALADLKATCARETASLNGLAAGDTNGARALADKAICDDVRTAAGLKLAAMEADFARKEEICRKEDFEATALEMKGPDGRDDLAALEHNMTCDRLRPSVHAALDRLAALPPADTAKQEQPKPAKEKEINTPELVTAAQAELHRLGCLDDRRDGKLDKMTRVGLDKYYEAHNKPVPNKVDIKINDEFLAELKAEKGPGCVVASLPPQQEEKHKMHPPLDQPVARHPPREDHPPARAERAPPPREHYTPHQSAGGGGYGGGGGGGGNGGGGGGGASMGGVGF